MPRIPWRVASLHCHLFLILFVWHCGGFLHLRATGRPFCPYLSSDLSSVWSWQLFNAAIQRPYNHFTVFHALLFIPFQCSLSSPATHLFPYLPCFFRLLSDLSLSDLTFQVLARGTVFWLIDLFPPQLLWLLCIQGCPPNPRLLNSYSSSMNNKYHFLSAGVSASLAPVGINPTACCDIGFHLTSRHDGLPKAAPHLISISQQYYVCFHNHPPPS